MQVPIGRRKSLAADAAGRFRFADVARRHDTCCGTMTLACRTSDAKRSAYGCRDTVVGGTPYAFRSSARAVRASSLEQSNARRVVQVDTLHPLTSVVTRTRRPSWSR